MIVPKKKKAKGEMSNKALVEEEAWMFQNPEILASIKRGLADAVEGRVSRINLDTL